MPKYRRNNYRRRRKNRYTKTDYLTKKSKTSQAYQILNLGNQVKAIRYKLKASKQWCQYQKNLSTIELDLEVNNGWQVEKLVDPTGWGSIWQASNEVENSNKLTIKSMYLEMYFRPQNSLLSLSPKIMTVSLVKLKQETAIEMLNDTGQMSSAGFGVNANAGKYWTTTDLGLTYKCLGRLSPACYRVIKTAKFQIQNIIESTALPDGEGNTDLTTPRNTYKRITWKIRMNNVLKTSSSQKWKDLTSDELEIKDRLFLIIHQGGETSIAEGDNVVDMSANCTFNCRGTN